MNYEDNPEICAALASVFDQNLCHIIFRTRPHKAWRLWERGANRDMSTFLKGLESKNKSEIYKWICLNESQLLAIAAGMR